MWQHTVLAVLFVSGCLSMSSCSLRKAAGLWYSRACWTDQMLVSCVLNRQAKTLLHL